MKPFVSSIVALLISSAPALAKLEIRNLQASHGPYGPERESWDVFPHDELFLRITVTGAKVDADGKTDGSLTIQLKGADGKLLQDRTVPALRKELNLGGDSFVIQGSIPAAEKVTPGEHMLILTYRDKLNGESASVERKVTYRPTTFQILAPRFYRDSDRKVPAPVGGLTGETLYFNLKVIGFDKSTKKVLTTMTATVLDKDGKTPVGKPIVVEANLLKPDEAAKASQATYSGALTLNRPGEFRLRIVVEDMVAKQKSTFEAPLKVAEP